MEKWQVIFVVSSDINELLKAFVIIDKLTDELNSRSDELYGTGGIWSEMHSVLENYLGEDFHENLSEIIKERGLG